MPLQEAGEARMGWRKGRMGRKGIGGRRRK